MTEVTKPQAFHQFSEYLDNIGLLSSDYAVLLKYSFDNSMQAKMRMTTLEQMENLLKNHDTLVNPPSMLTFSEDMKANNFKNLHAKTLAFSKECEQNKASAAYCKEKLQDIIQFTLDSSLNPVTKNDIVSFLENYKNIVDLNDHFNDEYINKFNANVESLNQALAKVEFAKTAITPKLKHSEIKVVPAAREMATQAFVSTLSFESAAFAFFILGFFIYQASSTYFYKKRLHTFYSKLLRLQKIAGLNVKVKGKISKRNFKKIESSALQVHDFFAKPRTYFGDLSFHFIESKKDLKVEANYVSKTSLQEILENSESEMGKQMRKMVSELEKMGGEVILKTLLDHRGLVRMTSLQVYFAN